MRIVLVMHLRFRVAFLRRNGRYIHFTSRSGRVRLMSVTGGGGGHAWDPVALGRVDNLLPVIFNCVVSPPRKELGNCCKTRC